MKWIIVSLVLCMASAASGKTLPTPEAARTLTDQVMSETSNGKLEAAIELMKPYSIIPPAEMDALIGQVKLQLSAIRQRFGSETGFEFIREDRVGTSLIRVVQIQKYENTVMPWTFIFYKGSNGWTLNSFYFNDKVQSLFPN